MAKKKETRTAAEEKVVATLRKRAERYLALPNVTSVGVGYKIIEGKPTNQLCIQFTVERKLTPDALEAEGIAALPESIPDDDGNETPVDVIQRSYEASYRLIEAEEAPEKVVAPEADPHRQFRRSRQEKVVPGISVSHVKGTAGTLGAIVYDNETSAPYILSNWHVLHGSDGSVGDAIAQPGPFDDGDVDGNIMGSLVRSHLGVAGDCAVSSIEGRDFGEEILGLDVTPTAVAKVNLGDRVVKSGRTTGVTHGVVRRVGVVVKINYGGSVGVQQVGGFEIGPDPQNPPADGEISKGGDSGSTWLIHKDDANGQDIVVGLHFAGETDPSPSAEHAVACNVHSVLEKLNVSLDPPSSAIVTDEDLWNEVFARLETLEARVALLGVESLTGCSCSQGSARAKSDAQIPALAGAGQPSAEGLSLPVYGNWCGPGHGSGTPIDAIDAACKRHDQCYDRKGYFDCQCDAKLISELDRALARGDVSTAGRVAGMAIRSWFTAQPCVYHLGKIPIPGGVGGLANVVRRGGTVIKSAAKAGKKVWKKIKNIF